MMQNEQQTRYISKIHVKTCCPIGNNLGCTLWTVSNDDGHGLGKFGTKTGAVDFAMGVANRRSLQQLRDSQGDADIIFDVVIEE